MQYKLQMLENLLLKAYTILIKPALLFKNFPELNIAHIIATSFYRQACKKENVSFYTSLYKLDRLIEDKSI